MASSGIIWKRFFSFLRPYLKYEALLLILMLITNAAALASPYFLKIIIDKVFPEKNLDLLVTLLLILAGIYIGRILLGMATDYLYNWISNQVLNSISLRLYSHIIRLPMSFFRETGIGDLVHRMSNEVNNVRHSLTGALIHFINNAITIVGLIVIMCYLEAKLFFVICLIYPLLFIPLKLLNPKIKSTIEKVRQKESQLLGHFSERFTNIKFVKLFNSYVFENRLIKEQFGHLVKLNLKGAILVSSSKSISLFLLSLIPLVTLGFGGWQVLQGVITVGTLIAFLQYANKLHDPFQNVVALYMELVNTSVSLSRIFELLDHPVQSNGNSQVKIPGKIKKIELNNIHFAYHEKPVLDDISFTFEAGRHYAIVGPSGSGKSTLVDLLCKFYSPAKGQILVNDKNLGDIDMSDWMQRISVNSQGYFVFNDTIIENIRYARPDAAADEVSRISKLVRLFNDQKDYDQRILKRIGDGGITLSGGQKQKLGLGRTLLKNSELLIIDEATSEIDSKSEEAIYDHLFSSTAIETIIVISHRLSTLKYMHEIIYMENGRILETGSMTELIDKRGHFYRLFENQLSLVKTP